MQWWQHIPEMIHPIAFTVGFFSVYWYALFYLAGFFGTFLFCLLERRRGRITEYSPDELFDLFFFLFIGVLIGARLGYALFYNLAFFLQSPLSLVSPYDFQNGVWTGISGMSYHGGLIGGVIALLLFVRKKKKEFWPTADFLSLSMPIAIFLGRLGNFFNGELYGRVTSEPWGMIFPGAFPEGVLRHPSELYEALLEGGVLFLLLFFFRRRVRFSGMLTTFSFLGYASLRFIGEFFREPDPQIGLFFGVFTLGQLFSLGMFLLGMILFGWFRKKNRATMVRQEEEIS